MTQNGAMEKFRVREKFCILTIGVHMCQNSSNVTLLMGMFCSCSYTSKNDFIKRQKSSTTSMSPCLFTPLLNTIEDQNEWMNKIEPET